MTANLFRRFKESFPDAPLQVGTVTASAGGTASVSLPGGGLLQARGDATIGTLVFVRDGLIEGAAPNLTLVLIDV